MATSSIYTNVTIRDKRLGRDFVSALEHAQNKKSKEVILTERCTELKKEDIQKIFGDKDEL